jgi:hypothetical protein
MLLVARPYGVVAEVVANLQDQVAHHHLLVQAGQLAFLEHHQAAAAAV